MKPFPSTFSCGLLAAALLAFAPFPADAQSHRQGGQGRERRVERPQRSTPAAPQRNRPQRSERRVERPRSAPNSGRVERDRNRPTPPRGRVERERNRPTPPRGRVERERPRGNDRARIAHRPDRRFDRPRTSSRVHVSTHFPRWQYHGHRYRRPYVVPARPALRSGGRWELRTRQVWVPAYTDQIWVEGECYTDAFGAPLCEPGQWVWQEFDGFYEPRQEWVWIAYARPSVHVHF